MRRKSRRIKPSINSPCPYDPSISCHYALAAKSLIDEGFEQIYSKCNNCTYLPEDIQEKADDEKDLRVRFIRRDDFWI